MATFNCNFNEGTAPDHSSLWFTLICIQNLHFSPSHICSALDCWKSQAAKLRSNGENTAISLNSPV